MITEAGPFDRLQQCAYGKFMVTSDTVSGLLSRSAILTPDKCAVVYENQRFTYAELESLAKRAAAGLAALGIGAGDRVAFWLPNTVAYLALYFGCARLGAVAVGINTRFRSNEVADLMSRSGARLVVVWPGFRNIDFLSILDDLDPAILTRLTDVVVYRENDEISKLPPSLKAKRVISFDELVDGTEQHADFGAPEHGCNVFTTSGTTKLPELVLHTQRSIARHAKDVCQSLGPVVGDGSMLQSLPFCGVFGFTTMVAAVAGGCRMVVTSSFDPVQAVELIDKHDVRYLNATDDMVLALLNADSREQALPNLVCCGFGAFNVSPEEVAARTKARGVRVVGVYGMSEVLALFRPCLSG